ncbi:IPT/TIG domain-containing protein [Spirosoma endophyticum]|uniref:IPT/TIG domain-containing protein n=1 Tax=Spirosoma endophyticum TaxID=662367 RepID=A0A1I1YK72_9BACT|nr:IPT/TIG domain-containing protein [Spirosoma endophyticum]SFE19946.1 IPT/TIG domain-containing protein [Spirosoma endophyticum]
MKPIISLLFLFSFVFGLSGCRLKNNPPELIGLSVKQAFVGREIVLTGYQFGSDPVVMFGIGTSTVTASISSHDDKTINIKVPYVSPGITQIRVQTDQGTSDPLPFIVQQPGPEVTSITPTNGLPGTPVVITGDFLNQIKTIKIKDVEAVLKDSSANKITVLVPQNIARGPGFLTINTKGGLSSNDFIVAGTPQITSISPLKTKPGAELVIKGVNLLDGGVRVNGKFPNQSLTNVTDTEIRTVVPTDATTGRVTVTVFDKLVATSTDTLQIYQQPFITHLQAQDGVAGEKLIIEGRNLSAVSIVQIGGVTASFRALSDTQLDVTLPALTSSGSVAISATSVGGTATSLEPFFFFLAPSAIVVTPARQLRGQQLTVSGKNLYRITDVRVNGIVAQISSRTEGTDLLIHVPDNGTSGPIVVTSRAGSATTVTPLVVVQKAVVTDFLPARATPGTRVVIRGDFLLNAQIVFAGSATAAVDDGKNTDTERWVLVPADAQTGPLRVTNATNETTITATPFTIIPN